MRTIERAGQFKKDFKLVKKQPKHSADVADLLQTVIKYLVEDIPLPPVYEDHPLTGDRRGYRDCHLKPDLVLIYKQTDDGILRLARIGSHAQLFG